MPIRINLLAEVQAAEEARRRDPVKRAVYVGVGLGLVLLAWIALLTMQVKTATSDLASQARRLSGLTNEYVAVSNSFRAFTDLDRRANSLVKYATNRFLWGSALDAFQQTTLSNVWLVQLSAVHAYVTNKEEKAETNLTFSLKEPRAWYQLRAADTKTNSQYFITNMFSVLTNRLLFITGRVDAVLKNDLMTNRDRTEVSGKLIALRPLATVETITINIKGRDFSSPPGSSIEGYTANLLSNPFFSRYLSRTNTSVDRDVRPTSDPLDKFNTNIHVAFEVKCTLPPRTRVNEK